ncbi:MAG: hypothetical protein QW327_05155 [Candidatus Odinarchaeota archaeon]
MAKLDELPRKGVLKGGFRVKDLGVCYYRGGVYCSFSLEPGRLGLP